MSEANPSNRFEAFLAICIAVATVVGAILAARAAVYNDSANDADQAGLSSAIDLALTQSSVEAQRTQNLSAFLEFAQHRRLAELISQQMDQIDSTSELWAQLDRESSAEWNQAVNSRYFFDANFYDKFSNTFDQQAFVDRQLAEAASLKDLNPDPEFSRADGDRTTAAQLIGLIALLAVALLCFAVANILESRLRYLVAGIGVLIIVGSIAAAVAIESGMV
ncbi:MAG TPA: hypothetical protein VMP08_09275 [Anaerolineae bacterium]|nr:hypothetical protein [Anaerolineae bacterium]